MPRYRIFRLKDSLRTQFRQLPHLSGVTKVKVKDYDEFGEVEAATPYAAWFAAKDSDQPLLVGDLLVQDAGDMLIVKFVGFEPAEWVMPEVRIPGEAVPAAAGVPA